MRVAKGGLISFILIVIVAGCNNSPADHIIEDTSRSINFIIPWAQGGGTDIISNYLLDNMSNYNNWRKNVIYRTGGSGILGHLCLSQSPKDGHTMGAITSELFLMQNQNRTNLGFEDFVFLGIVFTSTPAIIVKSDSPWSSIYDLIDDLEAYPGQVTASGTTNGGIWDIARLGFLKSANLHSKSIRWIPSDGASPSIQLLNAGIVDILTISTSEIFEEYSKGKVKLLAVMSEDRSCRFPNVPTLKELGYNFALKGWIAFAVPGGVSKSITDKLQNEIKRSCSDKDLLDALAERGFDLSLIQGKELNIFLEKNDSVLASVLDYQRIGLADF